MHAVTNNILDGNWLGQQKTTYDTEIQWNFTKRLEDLVFGNEVCLPSHKQQHAQSKLNRLSNTNRLQTFANKCLNIRWPKWISCEHLWHSTRQQSIYKNIITQVGMDLGIHWEKLKKILPGRHKAGTHREKLNWGRTIGSEAKAVAFTWAKLKRTTQNQVHIKSVAAALLLLTVLLGYVIISIFFLNMTF